MSSGPMPDSRSTVGTYFLGRYRVVDEIGVGGMASVHLARMDGPGGFQKWVAIKKIHAHLVEDDSFVQMFLDEARVAARISHPNVATVFDLGKHDDTYWIAMEYLHGEPLREVMRRTEELGASMPPEIACRVIADAAEGLHAAHELLGKNGEKLNLVHRDVTPHNLFVTYDGVTKVVDFGIAKFSSRMSSTRAGTLKGKLAYMSPEQVHGEQIDRRTDIFALGVVLWELTTGQRLFRSESDLDTLAKVQECNVTRPSTIVRGYPVDLEKIVMKALAKNRNERFKTAREFSRALQSLLMRRGLFIAQDEVATYAQSIFAERIQKRDAHLRWASEVTQTIAGAGLDSGMPKVGEHTNSDVAPTGRGPAAVLPAAGRPADGPPMSQKLPPPGSKQLPPPNAPVLPFAPAATTSVPSVGGPPRPQIKPIGAPPPQPPPGPPPGALPRDLPPYHAEEAHPSDGDGPTIQAAPSMLSDSGTSPQMRQQHHPAQDEPPTMMQGGPPRPVIEAAEEIDASPDEEDDEDQDATIINAGAGGASAPIVPPRPAIDRVPSPPSPSAARMAAAKPLASTMALGQMSPLPAVVVSAQTNPQAFPPPGRPGDMQFAETVAPNSNEIRSALAAGLAQAPAPPPPDLPPLDFNTQPPPSRGQNNGLGMGGNGMGNGMLDPMGGPPPPFDPFGMNAPLQGNATGGGLDQNNGFGQNMGGQNTGQNMGQNMGQGAPAFPPPRDFATGPSPLDYGAPMQGMQGGVPTANARYQPTVVGGRVDTALTTGKRRPPMWVVAAVSCSVALLVAGVFAVVISLTSGTNGPKKGPRPIASVVPSSMGTTGPSTSPTGPSTGTAQNGPVKPAASGAVPNPFSTARVQFGQIMGAPVTGMQAPSNAVSPPGGTTAAAPSAPTSTQDPNVAPAPTVAAGTGPTTQPQPAQPQVVQPAQPTARVQPQPQPQPAAQPQPVPQPVPQPAQPAGKGELGGLTVVCLPACTQVVDNGSNLGPSPIFARPVPSGPHTLTLTSGSVKKTYRTAVTAGKTTEVRQPMSD